MFDRVVVEAFVLIVVVIVTAVITRRVDKPNQRHSDGYQQGLAAGRNEPLENIQAQIGEAGEQLAAETAKIDAAKADHQQLTDELNRLAPLNVRIEHIKAVEKNITDLNARTTRGERDLEAIEKEIREQQHKKALYADLHGHRDNRETEQDRMLTTLSNQAMDVRAQLADWQLQITAGREQLVKLTDELSAMRRELTDN
jgi:chromosome segregation ATPase